MAPRPHWKGYLKLSLVSCPIALYPAVSPAERISFRQVNRQTGNRLRHQLVDAVTGEAVESHNKARGYEVGENRFLLVDDEELEVAREAPSAPAAAGPAFKPSAPSGAAGRRLAAPPEPEPPPEIVPPPRPRVDSRTIEIEHFVPRAQIHPRYFDKPYFIVPRDEVGQEAFAVIRQAMRGKEMVGIGRVVISARERPIALEPLGQGLCGMILHSRKEIRGTDGYFAEIPEITLPDEMLRVAEHILQTKAADFDLSMLEDHYQNALVQMLREKQADMPAPAIPAAPSPQNVINLMDALKRSLAAERPPAAKSSSRRAAAVVKTTPARRSSGRTRKAR